MARCGCAGTTCGCKLEGSGSVSVTGTGTVQDPYVVALGELSIEGFIEVDDTPTVNMTIVGDGTDSDPYVISAAVVVGTTVFSEPTNAGSTSIDDAESAHVFTHDVTIATHTVVLPESTAALKSEVTLFSDSEITALTVDSDGATTVVGAPTTIGAGNSVTMRLVGTTWRTVGVSWAS